jgi:protein-disulfide isomerase
MRPAVALLTLLAASLAGLGQTSGAMKGTGAQSPPVTIEIFSDFLCGGCKTLHDKVLPLLEKNYVATGKVRIVHREFPISYHTHSKLAATYAVAASRIGKYEAVAEALFANQIAWYQDGSVDKVVSAVLTAAELAKVRALVKEPSVTAQLDRDYKDAEKIPLRETPTLLFKKGGKSTPLATVNYDLIRRYLDELLAK